MINLFTHIFIVFTLFNGFVTCKKPVKDPVSASSLAQFESRLESLRDHSNIPGMAAGIIKNGTVTWGKNYGLADRQRNIPVTNSTIFHLASLTKTFASAVCMQLVNENKLKLNAPVADYGISLNEADTVRIIHLLTHTSEGNPGTNFKYNGDRYALLSPAILAASGQNFYRHVHSRIVQPLALQSTAPGDMKLAALNGYDTTALKQKIAQGYASNGNQTVDYPKPFSAAAGLVSNITDMLNYAGSYDGNILLSESMKTQIFSPMISNSGTTLPYGLGWFSQKIEGVKVDWHYGYWTGMSSLIIRVPSKKISFVLLANSDMLSAIYPLGNGNIWVSPYAKEFLKSFVLNGALL